MSALTALIFTRSASSSARNCSSRALASARLGALEQARALWLEEPFNAHALQQYGELAKRCNTVKLAGGEGAHNAAMAQHLIDYGGIGYVQIDCGRIGGIGPAKQVADYALARGVTYVNHTFTSHLALSASMQPFAGLADHAICEYPAAPKALAVELIQLGLGIEQLHLAGAAVLKKTDDGFRALC